MAASDTAIDAMRLAIIAGFAVPTMVYHPTISPAEAAQMLPHELAFFTDTPVAHEVAFLDFQREQRLERIKREAEDAAMANMARAARMAAYEPSEQRTGSRTIEVL